MSRHQRIEQKITQALAPIFLNIEDESSNHHVPKDGETHFKVTLVSPNFNHLGRIQRHRLVNQLLESEFGLGLHALSLHLYTMEEWEAAGKSTLKSPACKDGFGH
ncbi:MAG: BolA family transcriptional regulator [Legionella sp.]|nr:BolA family transcriptional regulator [Legionella sp.]